jgi:hypothetical protein
MLYVMFPVIGPGVKSNYKSSDPDRRRVKVWRLGENDVPQVTSEIWRVEVSHPPVAPEKDVHCVSWTGC